MSFKHHIILLSLTLDLNLRQWVNCDNPDLGLNEIRKGVTWRMEEVLAGPPKQDDPRIVEYARSSLLPPSTKPFKLKGDFWDPSIGQSSIVKNILRHKRGGFFVECGACDGVYESNTLDLERNYGWNGLLIEADPELVARMARINRKAWISPFCISPHAYPVKVPFGMKGSGGRILSEVMNSKEIRHSPAIFHGENIFGQGFKNNTDVSFKPVKIQCFPLFTLLLALGVKTVDYFSLDIEGLEFKVLQTIPFDRVTISILSVEYWINKLHPQAVDEMKDFMKLQGYDVITTLMHPNNNVADLIFVHHSVNTSHVKFKPETRFKYNRPYRMKNGYKQDWSHFKRIGSSLNL